MAYETGNIKRIRDSLDYSRKKLKIFRENRLEALRQYVGAHYSNDGSKDKVPENHIEMAVNIYSRQLAATSPKALVTTPHPQLKPYAENLRLALDHLFEEINLGKTLKDSVVDALFGVGLVKVAVNTSDTVEIGGFLHDVGQAYAETISLDDWVHDCTAKSWSQSLFFGNRYRMPLEDVRNAGIFDPAVTAQLQSTRVTGFDRSGMTEAAKGISGSAGSDVEEYDYVPMVELWDLYLPRTNQLITMPTDDQEAAGLLRGNDGTGDWRGPEGGPYHHLGFADVPDNIMPLPTVSMWMDLHMLSNKLGLKLGRQAVRQKTFTAVRKGADGDANKVVKVNDGECIGLDAPGDAKELRMGGIDNANLAYQIRVDEQLNRFMGNVDAMGGLSPQSETLGQDRLLTEAASKRLADMQDRHLIFTTKIVKALAWHLIDDPLVNLPLVKRFDLGNGRSIDIPTEMSGVDQEGDFLDYNFNIEPYSMRHSSPGEKLELIDRVLTKYGFPGIEMLREQGMSIDLQEVFRLYADYGNLPELMNIVYPVQSGPQSIQGTGPVQAQQPPRPATTHRISERISRAGVTQRGADQQMMQALLQKQPAGAGASG